MSRLVCLQRTAVVTCRAHLLRCAPATLKRTSVVESTVCSVHPFRYAPATLERTSVVKSTVCSVHPFRYAQDSLQCSYHGWRFKADGSCADIPQVRDNLQIRALTEA